MITNKDDIEHSLIDSYAEFLSRYYKDEIATAVQEGARSVTVEYGKLYQYDSDLALDTVEKPERLIPALDRGLSEVDIPVPGADNTLINMRVRLSGIDDHTSTVNTLRTEHKDTYIGLRGQVSRASQVKPRTVKAVFRCERCTTPDSDFLLDPIPQYDDEIQMPGECPGCERSGPYTLVEEESVMVDHQVIELADEPGENMGANSHTVPVHVYRDETGRVMPGDRIQVNGLITTDMARSNSQGKIPTSRPWRIENRSIDPEDVAFSEVEPERVDEIEELAKGDIVDDLVESVAPNIVSDERGWMHKLAIELQFFSGVSRGGRRGDINVFLVGSKGTGKSQLLSRAAELAPKSVEASGKGATAAGLTATATQSEHGGWMLDAGALVLASGGMAAIDEFDKMTDGARKSMHEAMEDQRVPINKAGINTVLPTKTAILAAANPMGGEFNRFNPLTEQLNLEAPLISRFDLIFGLIDTQDKEWDETVARAQYASETQDPVIPDDLHTEYIAYARQNIHPSFEDSSVEDHLVNWYVDKREEHADTEGLNIGPRTNDALRRISEASARMRLSDTIEMEDAERAIELKKMHFGDVMMNRDGEIDAAKGSGYEKAGSIKEAVEMVLDECEPDEGGLTVETIAAKSEEITGNNLSTEQVEEQIEILYKKGSVIEVKVNEYRLT